MWFTGPVFCGVLTALVLDSGEIGVVAGKTEARDPQVIAEPQELKLVS